MRHSGIVWDAVLENDDGHLRWMGLGSDLGISFSMTARKVRLEDNGRVLVAELRKIKGKWREDRIALDEQIANRNGELVFVQPSCLEGEAGSCCTLDTSTRL